MKKLLSLLFILIFSTSIVSCGEQENPTGQGNIPTDDLVYTTTIADFETTEDIYNVVDVIFNYSYEGYAVRVEEDAISGKGSLQWHVKGSLCDSFYLYQKNTGTSPTLFYSLWYNTKNEGNWGFTWQEVTDINADVYNANDFDIQVSMFYMTRSYVPVGHSFETIAPGQTKTVNFNLSRYYMQNELDKKISYLCIKVEYDKKILDSGELYYPEADIYIDNITANVDKTPILADDGSVNIDKKFAKNEILSFNDASDLDYLYVTGGSYVKEPDNVWITYQWMAGIGSSLKYNANKTYVKEGNTGSLCWTVNPTFIVNWSQDNYKYFSGKMHTYEATWTGFTLCHDFLNYYNFRKIINGEAKIAVDIYNAGSYDKEVAFGMHDKSAVGLEEKTDYPYSYNELVATDKWTKLKAGEWTTLEITDFSQIDFSAGLGRLRLITSLIDVFEPVEFYVNNLRIVEI